MKRENGRDEKKFLPGTLPISMCSIIHTTFELL
jgi:hypothetical protein